MLKNTSVKKCGPKKIILRIDLLSLIVPTTPARALLSAARLRNRTVPPEDRPPFHHHQKSYFFLEKNFFFNKTFNNIFCIFFIIEIIFDKIFHSIFISIFTAENRAIFLREFWRRESFDEDTFGRRFWRKIKNRKYENFCPSIIIGTDFWIFETLLVFREIIIFIKQKYNKLIKKYFEFGAKMKQIAAGFFYIPSNFWRKIYKWFLSWFSKIFWAKFKNENYSRFFYIPCAEF